MTYTSISSAQHHLCKARVQQRDSSQTILLELIFKKLLLRGLKEAEDLYNLRVDRCRQSRISARASGRAETIRLKALQAGGLSSTNY